MWNLIEYIKCREQEILIQRRNILFDRVDRNWCITWSFASILKNSNVNVYDGKTIECNHVITVRPINRNCTLWFFGIFSFRIRACSWLQVILWFFHVVYPALSGFFSSWPHAGKMILMVLSQNPYNIFHFHTHFLSHFLTLRDSNVLFC